MNYKEKLINLLCEVEYIKKDLKELRFWTYVEVQNRFERIKK